MSKHLVLGPLLAVTTLSALSPCSVGRVVHSQPMQITNGITYLKSTQNIDGSWGGNATSLNAPFPTTATVLEALHAIEPSTSSNQTNAIQFLSAQAVDVNPFMAARITALAGSGNSTTSDVNALLAAENADGGWGTADVFQSDNLDTSFALLGLSAGKPNISVVYQAVFYLINRQNTDGGWPLTQGEDSQIYYTAMALQALNAARLPYSTSLSQNSAVSYLRSQQNADGGYGAPVSTPFETAVTLIAIIGTGQQLTNAETRATSYLNSTQQANGSWVDDAYSTALALRALTFNPPPLVPRLPAITSQPVKNARPGQLYSYQVTANDPDNLPLTFSLLRGPTGMTISSTGLVQWTTSAAQTGSSVVIIQVANSNGATVNQEYSVTVLAGGVDLTVASVDASAVNTDPNTLVATGSVRVQIGNQGGSLFSGSFNILLFEDRNGNGIYEAGVDNALGTGRFDGNIDSGGSSPLDLRASGIVQFRDNAIYAFVDSANEIPEPDETNNYGNSGRSSKYQPPVGDWLPKVKWQYDLNGAFGANAPPVVAPLVDTNGDGKIDERDVPAVIFAPIPTSGNGYDAPIALRGDTGQVIFTGARSGIRSLGDFNQASIAVGDIDGDGKPEILANSAYNTNAIYCFNNDGTYRWTSGQISKLGSITIADLDGDGKSEIIEGETCLNSDGTIRWLHPSPTSQPVEYFGGVGFNQTPLVVDLNLDGKQEVVLGPSAVDKDGKFIWYWKTSGPTGGPFNVTGTLDGGKTTQNVTSDADLFDGFTAAANLDADPNPEIVVVCGAGAGSNWVSAWIFEHDGRLKAGPIHLFQNITNVVTYIPGHPTIADFDGDGQPEIAIPVEEHRFNSTPDQPDHFILNVYKFTNTTLQLLWQRDALNGSGSVPPAVTSYDFDGDGSVEAVFMDGYKLYILNGHTGASLYEIGVARNNTDFDPIYATVADVDNDGVAEILVPSWQSFTTDAPTRHGLFAIGDTKGNWRNARRIWNQYVYEVTDVNENGSIPRVRKPFAELLNSHLAQTSVDGLDRNAAPDLSVSKVTINSQGCPASAGITARIGNGGSLHTGAGINVNFYVGDPAAGGILIGKKQTTRALYPGDFDDVSLIWNAPTAGTVFVTVNDPPTANPVGSSNLSLLPSTWAESNGLTSGDRFDSGAFFGIDGLSNTLWSDAGAVISGQHFYQLHFPFPVNASLVTIQNAGAANTGFLTGTLSFSNGFTQPITLNASGEGTVSFTEQQNITWVRLTASTVKPNGVSLSEFIVGGKYTEPAFRINEGTGRLNNNKATAGANVCDAGNKPPQIVSAPVVIAQIGALYSYQVQAVDPNNDPLSFSLSTAPAGMTISSTGLVKWKPSSGQAGDSQVNVQVSDGRGGTAQQTFMITVPMPNRDPKIASTAPPSVVLGQTYRYNISSFDPDGDTVIFALRQSPAAATIDPLSGSILWTPTGLQLGTNFFTVEAQDGKGGISSQSFTVEVLDPPTLVQFSASNYSVVEACTTITITVNRTGDTSAASSVDYFNSDGTATERGDYITALGTLRFAPGETSKTFVVLINDDSYVEGTETFSLNLSNPSGASLGSPAISTVTIIDNPTEPATNVIDDPRNNVCQHYHDFLNRQADPSGWDFWTNQITSCGGDIGCAEVRRLNVSASFFLSIEFQQTGFLVERMYKVAYGDASGTSTFGSNHQLAVPVVRFKEFLRDTQRIGQGVVVLAPGWEQLLESNKQAFAGEFVQTTRFTTAFPASLTPAQFINQLNTNAGKVLTPAEVTTAINLFGGAGDTSNTTARAQAVRQVAENAVLNTAEFNRAFVLMQFFGYLRRNPNDPQDTDYTGYDFWLTKLNQFNGNYINAEMVRAFLSSIEFRQRFGP